MSHLLKPAFTEPVAEAQNTFRAVLDAMSEPGTIQTVNGPQLSHLNLATYCILLTLLDSETSLWLNPLFKTDEIITNLAFHCGCPIVDAPQKANFALLDAENTTDFTDFSIGSQRYPDTSCTVIIQLSSLHGGNSLLWQGPGILDSIDVDLPLPETFWQTRSQLNKFPQGLDFIFTANEQMLALPRSTKVVFH